MKKRIQLLLRTALFLVLFCASFYVADKTLQFKYDDGVTPMEDFYTYPEDSIDVLLLGSSHLGVNIDTTILCNQYGIASYKLWGSTQPIWNAYYDLSEALKTQHPKVVVMEVLGLLHDTEYYEYANAVKNTMGMKWGKNKIDAIFASYEPDSVENAFFPLTQYHSRYGELTEADFSHYFWNNTLSEHNTQNWNAVAPMDPPSATTEKLPLGEKQMTYFKKIIYLCQKNDIPLMVLTAPYTTPDDERARLNTVADMLKEENIPQLDCLTAYQKYGFDFETDFGDTAGHLNSTGCAKLSAILGEYLKDNYDLPDRTGDPLFAYTIPSDAAYVLGTPFEGNGTTDFIDTEQKLYSSNKDFTIFTRFSTTCESKEKTIFSCFSESEPYRGLLVRFADDGKLDVVVGNNYYTKIDLPEKDQITMAITKSGSLYSIYLEGALAAQAESDCDAYSGSLLIGAERIANNTLGRLGAVSVDKFEVYNTAKSSNEAMNWTSENRVMPTREQQLSALKANYTGITPYTLPESFTGDGTNCVDTGVQLYANPSANWRLTANLVIGDEDGTYLSCFNEEENAYRGLLVRKTQNTLSVQVGNSTSFSTLVYAGRQNELVIEKRGSAYTVTLNGEVVGTTDSSPCEAYYGTLLVDAERDFNLEPFRNAALTVSSLTVEPLE